MAHGVTLRCRELQPDALNLAPVVCQGERSHQPEHLYSSRRWRVRAAKGARLESACGGNLTVGSNPTATAIFIRGICQSGLALFRGL
jgi:hypothetical protein